MIFLAELAVACNSHRLVLVAGTAIEARRMVMHAHPAALNIDLGVLGIESDSTPRVVCSSAGLMQFEVER